MATGPRNLIILAIFEYNRLLLADVLRDSDEFFLQFAGLTMQLQSTQVSRFRSALNGITVD